MHSHCVLNEKMTFLRCTCYILNIRIKDSLPKHTWIMRLHGVLILKHLKHVILLIIVHRLNPLGWLAFSWCFAHLGWYFVVLFFIFVLRLQWAKKLGWLFLAVGGRSSMREWQLTATLGDLRWHWVTAAWMILRSPLLNLMRSWRCWRTKRHLVQTLVGQN